MSVTARDSVITVPDIQGHAPPRRVLSELRSSKWNFTVPAVALVAWSALVVSAIVYGSMKAHNFSYPSNQVNPVLVDGAIDAIKWTGVTGCITIPLSVGHTIVRATYQGCSSVGRGLCNAGDRFYEVVKKSVHRDQLFQRDGIVINTLAAVVGGPVLVCCALGKVDWD